MFNWKDSLFLLALTSVSAAISVTDTDDGFTVDTGGDLVVTFESTSCDITSILYQGDEYTAEGESSHMGSGIPDGAESSYEIIGEKYAVVSCSADDDSYHAIQYHVFTDGSSAIYLGTYTLENPTSGELRFIFRLQNVEGSYPTGNVSVTTDGEIIESSDIYLVGDETRAKRFIDDDVSCGYGNIYACFVKPLRGFEASTGGPFARDIRLNFDTFQDITYYMNHGVNDLDPYRLGFHGPYIFVFAEDIPQLADYEDISFLEDLGLTGYVGDSGRGGVRGSVSGTSPDLPIVVHWYNDDYQQWAYASDDGSFESPLLVAGTYTQAAYQDELLAATITVDVEAGATATASLSATNPIITADRTTVFQIGGYDGRPVGLLNADKQHWMHPSDERLGDWAPGTFTVGSSADEDFPMALFQDVNSGQEINFSLDDDIGDGAKIRVATTIIYKYGVPKITVNDFECPSFDPPSYTTDGRGITKGITHGGMDVYECEIESGVLASGTNTVVIDVESSSSENDGYLSPNFVIDAVELYY